MTEDAIMIEVRGLPIPQGSTRAYVPKGWTHPVITSSAKGLKAWRQLIADQAQSHAPPELWSGPIGIVLEFRLPKPKSEPKRRRTWPDRRPDLDKLSRGAFDALTNVIFRDDSQIVQLHAEKDWGAPGVRITLKKIEEVETHG